MIRQANVIRYDVPMDHLDEAARIFVCYATRGLQEMEAKGLDCGAAVQAVIQMSMRAYADLIGDDGVAIMQIRGFIDDWERDLQ